MTDHPSKNGTAQVVVEFPNAEEKARRLRVDVERLAKLPVVEWMFYLSDIAKKHGIEVATLRQMIEAVIKAAEKQAREARGELRRAEKQRRESEHKQERKQEREEERRREREEREARKEEERKDREKQKAFEAIIKLPGAEH